MAQSYLVIADGLEEAAHRHEVGVVFDSFVRVSSGIQYLMGRTADFWLYTPRAWDAMTPQYLEALGQQAAKRPDSEVMPLGVYLDRFFNPEDE